MCDEYAVLVDVISVLQLVDNIVDNNLIDAAAVFLAGFHLAVDHLDQGLELEKIGSERRNLGAASALSEIVDAVYDEARLDLVDHRLALRLDLGGRFSLLSELRSVEHNESRTC